MDERYKSGKIYEVINKLKPSKFYIGSTITTLHKRMYDHRNQKRKNTLLRHAMEKYGRDNFKINLLEDYPCDSRQELLKRESEWQTMYNPVYNLMKAYLSPEDKIKQHNISQAKWIKLHGYDKKVKCECGNWILKVYKRAHCKRKVHLDKMKK